LSIATLARSGKGLPLVAKGRLATLTRLRKKKERKRKRNKKILKFRKFSKIIKIVHASTDYSTLDSRHPLNDLSTKLG